MKVFVYFNLHKKCWSVKALQGPDRGRMHRYVRKYVGRSGKVIGEAKNGMLLIQFKSHTRCIPAGCVVVYFDDLDEARMFVRECINEIHGA